ncbi:DnaJ-class molecular chaperone with C-terminal Zn finger domain [Leptolyngbyaceae cyanobacterium JSC-12]|nr:DnaJ-class molecular chaperone with C-terminal Zn finger domain [Leptolyngbyaceae cyanobacterium JSC-12]
MADNDHYNTLEVSPTATHAEIKQSYRRLAKLFHPDSNRETANHEHISRLNAAYEVLGDPQSRKQYDQQRRQRSLNGVSNRQHRTAAAQDCYRKQQQTGQQVEEDLKQWLNQVYTPVIRLLHKILDSLKDQIDELAADPFDDDLMQDFQDYLEDCQNWLEEAERRFRSLPNPPVVAGAAANLFYCLLQVGDGIEQLEFFTNNYDEHYLHTGEELFRIARGLRYEAQVAVRAIAATL